MSDQLLTVQNLERAIRRLEWQYAVILINPEDAQAALLDERGNP